MSIAMQSRTCGIYTPISVPPLPSLQTSLTCPREHYRYRCQNHTALHLRE